MNKTCAGAICLCIVFSIIPVQAQTSKDNGYFLSAKQKGQLIATGKIKDDQGHQYKILIVPGYQPPVQSGWVKIKKAKHNIGEFFHMRKYRRLKTLSREALSWSYKDCLWKFTLKGAGKSWTNNFNKAARVTKTKVFGWWLAYPWAIVRSTADNAARIPAGLLGTAGGTVDGLVLTPAFFIVDSPVKAAWNGGIVGAAVPTVEVAWNTAVAPPLALLGQKPTPARVDGFWVKQLDYRIFSEDEAKLWVQLGRELFKKAEPVQKERNRAEESFKVQQESLQKQMQEMWKDRAEQTKKFNLQDEAIVRDFPLTGPYESLEKTQHEGKLPSRVVRDNMNKIKSALENEPDLDKATRSRIIRLLSVYFPDLLPYGSMLPNGLVVPPLR
jgi:hypothetical protein